MTKVETGKKEKTLVVLLTSNTKAEAYKTAHIYKATANRTHQVRTIFFQYLPNHATNLQRLKNLTLPCILTLL